MYVGVDVGQDEVWAVAEDAKPRMYSHSRKGIGAMWRWAKRLAGTKRMHFCMEATGVYSRSLAVVLLSHEQTEVSIVNPAQISAFGRAQLRRTKTDRVDARVILAFARSQKPSVWVPESRTAYQLYQLVVHVAALRKDLRRCQNRRHTHGYLAHLPTVLRTTHQAVERCLQRQIAKIEETIEEVVASSEQLTHEVDLLCTIPGIASRTAIALIAYTKGSMVDRSARALVAHAGLAPAHHDSGRSVHGRGHLAKQGDKRLRTALYMPALVASGHNPVLKPFYQRLVKNGKPKKLALAACMKKLLLISRAVLKTKQPFNPAYNC
jgi:transposase